MDLHRKDFTYEQWRIYRRAIMQTIAEMFKK